jgi:hypothetical protein
VPAAVDPSVCAPPLLHQASTRLKSTPAPRKAKPKAKSLISAAQAVPQPSNTDGDVEDLQLQSPVPEPPRQPTVPSRSRRGSLAGPVGDDDDDMEAQLALAMAAEEDDEEPAPRLDESDEDVSEEE